MAKAKTVSGTPLLDALKFVAIGLTKDQPFGVIHGDRVVVEAVNFSVGIPAQSELDLCPHISMMTAALRQCKQGHQLVQLDSHNISIKAGSFRAVIPALHIDEKLTLMCEPDPQVGTMTPELIGALVACKDVPKQDGDRTIDRGVLLQTNSCAATNGGLLMEVWHGIALPAPVVIPNATIEALSKISLTPTGFGFSPTTFTFWFEGGAFIKSKLVESQFPIYDKLFTTNAPVQPIWPGFWEAFDAIEKFVADVVYFKLNELRSTDLGQDNVGAGFAVPGLPDGHKFTAKFWSQIRPFVHSIAIDKPGERVILTGNVARVVMVGRY